MTEVVVTLFLIFTIIKWMLPFFIGVLIAIGVPILMDAIRDAIG